MKVHFVCSGNYYRSRLAEAYLNSQQVPGVEVSSSGTISDIAYDLNGPIAWYALRLMKNNGLIPFMKALPTQTNAEILYEQDLVIFMSTAHYEYARDSLGFDGNNYEIWNISDLDDFREGEYWRDAERMQVTEKTFGEIKEKVDRLTEQLAMEVGSDQIQVA